MQWVRPSTSGYSKSASVESNVLIWGDAVALASLDRKAVSIGLDLGHRWNLTYSLRDLAAGSALLRSRG